MLCIIWPMGAAEQHSGNYSLQAPAPSPERLNGSDAIGFRHILASVICTLCALGVVVSFYLCWRKTRKARTLTFFQDPYPPLPSDSWKSSEDNMNLSKPRPTRLSSTKTKTEVQVLTYKQLVTATNNFSMGNVIGNGSFGSVYKGMLPSGRTAAIKELDLGRKQGDREFRIEVDLLSRLHSPHLVQMLGYCADQNHRLLVFEYMPNGNLQDHLYPDGSSSNHQILAWGTRLSIAFDSARGLEYLHEGTKPPIIHRDFKTSNILLDQNFKAKVSDFGLAKLGSEKLDGQVSTRVLGTTGYVSPEYALTGQLTVKSDVYGFGVVLLELLTGRMPVDMDRPPGEGVLVNWALPYLLDREKVTEIVDPAIQGQYSKMELLQVASIAAMCVHTNPECRPFMTDVVQSLVPLVKQGTIKSRLASPSNIFHHPT